MKTDTIIANALSKKYNVSSEFIEKLIASDNLDNSFYSNHTIHSKYNACKEIDNALFAYNFSIEFSNYDFENRDFEVKCVIISVYKNDSKDDGEFDCDYSFEDNLKMSLKEAYNFVLENELELGF